MHAVAAADDQGVDVASADLGQRGVGEEAKAAFGSHRAGGGRGGDDPVAGVRSSGGVECGIGAGENLVRAGEIEWLHAIEGDKHNEAGTHAAIVTERNVGVNDQYPTIRAIPGSLRCRAARYYASASTAPPDPFRRLAPMKKAWQEFKAFAMGGNMLDLAIGFIIGAAFAGLVESLAKNIIGDLIAALVGKPDMTKVVINAGKGSIHIGNFLTDVLNFLILGAVLFGMVKGLKKMGIGNFRAQGQRECPYCREFVAVDAIRCRHCTSNLAAVIDGDEGADERLPV